MSLPVYRAAIAGLWPLVRVYLALRLKRGKEDPARFTERLGKPSLARPNGSLIWFHAASVGESISLLPLLDVIRARHPELGLLVTTGTVTSARLLAQRLPTGILHQYVPVDHLSAVRRFLDHWRPDLALWAESEFWPNLLTETAGRGVPLILINGRVSPSSFRGWRRAPSLIGNVLNSFALCLGQSEEDAERLRVLGAPQVRSVGNLKFAAPPLPADETQLRAIEVVVGDRPRWLAASTHDGEEEIAARVHLRLAGGYPGLLTLIVPRHPERGAAIAANLESQGYAVARRGARQPIKPETGIYVADTLGELGLFFRLASIVFMGKSLLPASPGGQNPLEAARLGDAVLHGPHMDNFVDITRRMAAAGASLEVRDEPALAEAVDRLLADPDLCARLGDAGRALAGAEDHILTATLAELEPYLESAAKGGG